MITDNGSVLARQRPRRRFEPVVESLFAEQHLQRSRGRVRAWHTVVLAVLLVAIVPVVLSGQAGEAPALFRDTWSRTSPDLLLALVLVLLLSRTALVVIAWSPWYERLYPHAGLPLVALCHASWAFACSGEILGAHPEYLAPLVSDAFAAYFFSGLLFRQALAVSAAAAAGLLLGGWYHAGTLAPIGAYGTHLFVNMIMAAIAGAAHERSLRNLFIEHALLSDMAARDGLTGLKNRRAFDEHLPRVWQQALRERKSLAILMIDVDEFKDYNDGYGHQAGDEALKRIASLVDGAARRPLDLAARYGGEEFTVVLYELSRGHVVHLARQLQQAVENLAIEHRGSIAGCVTVSIGVAIIHPTLRRSPHGAVQLADEALYEAKREGRNRVHVLEHEYASLDTGSFRSAASAP